ncbi:MAG: MBOAT family O-acyltransferase [Gemmiger sp.]|uniref:MBOAT family O-acyltransferase n=1 Tax=Gemmiger sp. TaxID=2049027 RepID=UPI002E778416|nr:MBOAT family O-acyltransferase [Gemmiger sp.]MEE0800234.1 MBOAT family O-acyltransferase [Gemmiger sp.]
MSFTELVFFPFLLVTGLLYFLVPISWRWTVLLAASAVFYLSWGPQLFPFILGMALIAWLGALAMERRYRAAEASLEGETDRALRRSRQAAAKQKTRRVLMPCAAVLTVLLVGIKVARLLESKVMLTGPDGQPFSVLVPLGLSYYTLSLVGYLADVYWRKEKAEPNFFKFFLFVLYFPKILQGPISRHKDLGPQLSAGHPFDYHRLCSGVQLMLWGYFKKLVIADRLAVVVDTVFGSSDTQPGSVLLVAGILASFQLYCDFSGCMDMAQGFSEIVGIRLEKNFDHPFFSASAAEFWRRWHITLGSWFRDYIYMPLAISPRVMKLSAAVRKRFGKRAGKAVVTVIPSAVVWVLTGLWHGTGWNYLVWGLYWGALIILTNVLEPEIRRLNQALHIRTDAPSFHCFRQVRTFLIFTFGRLLTVPGTLAATGLVLQRIVTAFQPWALVDGTLYALGLDRPDFLLAMLSLVLLWGVSMMQRHGSVREKIAGCNVAIRWTIYYAAFFAVLIFGFYGAGYNASAFVYMNY